MLILREVGSSPAQWTGWSPSKASVTTACLEKHSSRPVSFGEVPLIILLIVVEKAFKNCGEGVSAPTSEVVSGVVIWNVAAFPLPGPAHGSSLK